MKKYVPVLAVLLGLSINLSAGAAMDEVQDQGIEIATQPVLISCHKADEGADHEHACKHGDKAKHEHASHHEDHGHDAHHNYDHDDTTHHEGHDHDKDDVPHAEAEHH